MELCLTSLQVSFKRNILKKFLIILKFINELNKKRTHYCTHYLKIKKIKEIESSEVDLERCKHTSRRAKREWLLEDKLQGNSLTLSIADVVVSLDSPMNNEHFFPIETLIFRSKKCLLSFIWFNARISIFLCKHATYDFCLMFYGNH